MELLVWIGVHTCTCKCMYVIYTSIHTYTQKAVQVLISPLNCDEDDGIQIFSFLLESHIYCSVQRRNSFELVRQREMNLPFLLPCCAY